mmetsp:Transcript_32207/g.52047  ORF Transcript_32207/g.52047 Transcript_32207/m.52047 type:complete len:200 (-) Transcript_32207:398-997(-)
MHPPHNPRPLLLLPSHQLMKSRVCTWVQMAVLRCSIFRALMLWLGLLPHNTAMPVQTRARQMQGSSPKPLSGSGTSCEEIFQLEFMSVYTKRRQICSQLWLWDPKGPHTLILFLSSTWHYLRTIPKRLHVSHSYRLESASTQIYIPTGRCAFLFSARGMAKEWKYGTRKRALFYKSWSAYRAWYSMRNLTSTKRGMKAK